MAAFDFQARFFHKAARESVLLFRCRSIARHRVLNSERVLGNGDHVAGGYASGITAFAIYFDAVAAA